MAKSATRPAPTRRPSPRRGSISERPRRVRPLALVAVAIAAGVVASQVIGSGNKPRPAVTAASAPFVGGDLHSLVVDPTTPGRIYVGGHQGAAVSTDGGHRWRRIPSLNDADAMGWGFADGSVWQAGHPGIHRSSNGVDFDVANAGLPSTDIHALGAGGGAIYAASPAGLLASLDTGRTWTVRSDIGRGFMGRILVDPADRGHLVAADMAEGAAESKDGGVTWAALGGTDGAMWVTWRANEPTHLVVSGPRGAAGSDDGGKSWVTIKLPAGAMVVEADPHSDAVLYAAALRDSAAIIWRSDDAGGAWRRA
ncbi:MAG TPA: sialidase family protein [Acidimicrobiales bacterium]|nr:sialidase family protein [Acidimicrobiales bacterium]